MDVNAGSGEIIPNNDEDTGRRRIVGVGGMNRMCKALIAGNAAMPKEGEQGDDVAVETRFGSRVQKFEFDATNRKWMLHITTRTARTVAATPSGGGDAVQSSQTKMAGAHNNQDVVVEGPFDGLVASDKLLASDAVSRLFGDAWPLSYVRGTSTGLDAMIADMRATQSTPSFVLMLELSMPIRPSSSTSTGASDIADDTFDGAVVLESDTIAWIAKDSSKPGHNASGPAGERWVIQSTGGFAAEKLGAGVTAPYNGINEEMFDAFVAVMSKAYGELNIGTGSDGDIIVSRSVHRWGAAFPSVRSEAQGAVLDTDLMVASCGDWSMLPNMEGAIVSGLDAGEQLADALIARNSL